MKTFGKFLKITLIIIVSVAVAFCAGFVGFQMLTGHTFKESVGTLGEIASMMFGADNEDDGAVKVEITLGDGTVVTVSEEVANHIKEDGIEIENEAQLKEYIEIAQSLGEIGAGKTTSPEPTEDTTAMPTEDPELTKAKKVASDAIGRLTSAEISELSAMMSDGLTGEEKVRAKQIIYSKFSASEIDYYMTLYNKYGMSLID